MLKETIRKYIVTAMKLKRESAKNVLKVVLGEIETQESRSGKLLSDEDIHKVVRKTLQGIDEMLQYKPGDEGLEMEKRTLQELLPKQLDSMDVLLNLTSKIDELKLAKSDGQATGIAMKFFKESKLLVDGNIVAEVVKSIRQPK